MIVPKREKDISEIENNIIGLYALGMTIRDIAQEIKELYGCEISEGLVSVITDIRRSQIFFMMFIPNIQSPFYITVHLVV